MQGLLVLGAVVLALLVGLVALAVWQGSRAGRRKAQIEPLERGHETEGRVARAHLEALRRNLRRLFPLVLLLWMGCTTLVLGRPIPCEPIPWENKKDELVKELDQMALLDKYPHVRLYVALADAKCVGEREWYR